MDGFYAIVDMKSGKALSDTGYEMWGSGQPDISDDKGHCGSMFRDGLLNDVDCETRAMFVCEKPLSNTRPEPLSSANVSGLLVILPDA
jgi:hypothetical protein